MKNSVVLPLLIIALTASAKFGAAQSQDQPIHAPDGGTWERIQSISIPALRNAPFRATVNTEWTRILEDGTTVTIQNHRTVVRDSTGRIYQQRTVLVPDGQDSKVWRIEISDPARHLAYFCFPAAHACASHPYFSPVLRAPLPEGPRDDNNRYLTRVALGTNTIGGVDVVGTRETTTIAAGAMGNDHAITITKDFWYSPKLGINLSVKRVDPRSGTETFSVSDISLAEPDPRYFAIPAGYRMETPAQPRAVASAPTQ